MAEAAFAGAVRRIAALLPVLAACSLAAPAAAQLSAPDRADVARVEAYLNALKSIRSGFIQTTSGGGSARGRILVQRPRQLRIDYAGPAGQQVFVNGNWLVHVDPRLEAVTHVPVSRTPARFLVGERIGLSGDVAVRQVARRGASMSIELVQTAEPDAGSFVLIFAEGPLTLWGWIVTDVQGLTTQVTLVQPVFDEPIPRELFVFDSRRFERDAK